MERLSTIVDTALFKAFEKGSKKLGEIVRVEVESRHEVWCRLRDKEDEAHTNYSEKVIASLSDPSQNSFDETDKAYRKLEHVRKEQARVPRNVSVVLFDRRRVVLYTKVDEQKPWPYWD